LAWSVEDDEPANSVGLERFSPLPAYDRDGRATIYHES
jgi:hypothetical protein